MKMTWYYCGESEEALNVMIGRSVEMYKRRDLKREEAMSLCEFNEEEK